MHFSFINRRLHRQPSQKAQGMIEFALTLPLLLLIMLAIIEFGRLLFYYAAVTTSAREAARYAAATGVVIGFPNYQDCDGIREAALRMGGLVGMQDNDSDIQIRYQDANRVDTADTCPPGGTGPDLGLGERVVVTTTAHFRPMVPLITLPTYNIQAVSRRTILKDIQIK